MACPIYNKTTYFMLYSTKNFFSVSKNSSTSSKMETVSRLATTIHVQDLKKKKEIVNLKKEKHFPQYKTLSMELNVKTDK